MLAEPRALRLLFFSLSHHAHSTPSRATGSITAAPVRESTPSDAESYALRPTLLISSGKRPPFSQSLARFKSHVPRALAERLMVPIKDSQDYGNSGILTSLDCIFQRPEDCLSSAIPAKLRHRPAHLRIRSGFRIAPSVPSIKREPENRKDVL